MGLFGDIKRELKARLEGEDFASGGLHENSRPGEAYLGLSDQWLVILEKRAGGVDLQVRDREGNWGRRRLRSVDDLGACWDEIREAVRRWAVRVTVHGLRPGARYRVVRSFEDFYRNAFAAGEELTFASGAFLPYEGGHTLTFRERTMYVRDDTDLYARFGLFLEEVWRGGQRGE